MAIAFDTSVNGGISNGTSLTWSHTCTGSNLILFVGTHGPVSSTDDITGITYNGVALTKIDSQQIPGDRLSGLWYLIGPATGAHNVVISFTGTYAGGISSSYTGANQSGQPDSHNKGSASASGSITVSTTTVADNTWLVGEFGTSSGGAITAGANTTLRTSNTGEGFYFGDSNSAQTPAGSHSLSASKAATNWALVVASIAPFSAPAVGGRDARNLSLLGVG